MNTPLCMVLTIPRKDPVKTIHNGTLLELPGLSVAIAISDTNIFLEVIDIIWTAIATDKPTWKCQ